MNLSRRRIEYDPSVNVLGLDQTTEINRNASEIATGLIRTAIFEGHLEPGQRLKEGELAQNLGISRTPVREALMVLQAEGLVSAVPNRGAVVRSYTEKDLIDMYDLRAVLESHAAHRAASRVSAEQLGVLQRSCDAFEQLRKKRDRKALVEENRVFHATIIEAADTSNLAELIQHAVRLPFVYSTFLWFSEAELEKSEICHRAIVVALEAGKAKRAERLMKHHLLDGRDFLVAHFARHASPKAVRRKRASTGAPAPTRRVAAPANGQSKTAPAGPVV